MVAWPDLRDTRSHLLDNPRAFVAADNRITRHGSAGEQVEVGVAQAGRAELDQHLTDTGTIQLNFGDLERPARTRDDSCLRFHELSCQDQQFHSSTAHPDPLPTALTQ